MIERTCDKLADAGRSTSTRLEAALKLLARNSCTDMQCAQAMLQIALEFERELYCIMETHHA